MAPASPTPAGTPAAAPPDPGSNLYRLCREVMALWWALSTVSFVVMMAGLGLQLLTWQVTHVDLFRPMGMGTGALAVANDQGAPLVLAVAFVLASLLSTISLWAGTAPFLRR